MPYESASACVVTVSTKVYIAGGRGYFSQLATNRTVMYDTVSNTWTELAQMGIGRYAAGCTYNDGKIYVFGGATAVVLVTLNSVEIYDILSDTWTGSTAELSANSAFLSAAYMNVENRNLAVVMGGRDDDLRPPIVHNNLDVYDMDLDEIVFRGNMNFRRWGFNAITLSSNKFVLVCTLITLSFCTNKESRKCE